MIEHKGVFDEFGDDITQKIREGEVARPFYLYDIQFDPDQPPYRLTNRENGITVTMEYYDDTPSEEHYYMPWAITHDEITESTDGELHGTEVSMATPQKMAKTLQQYRDLNGAEVVITQMEEGQTTIWPSGGLRWFYAIDGYTIDDVEMVLTLGVDIDLLGTEVGRLLFRSCQHEFGGPACKYKKADGEQCGRTLSDCKRKGNLLNFGGEPGLCHDQSRGI